MTEPVHSKKTKNSPDGADKNPTPRNNAHLAFYLSSLFYATGAAMCFSMLPNDIVMVDEVGFWIDLSVGLVGCWFSLNSFNKVLPIWVKKKV